jgi:hypothetical protein
MPLDQRPIWWPIGYHDNLCCSKRGVEEQTSTASAGGSTAGPQAERISWYAFQADNKLVV